VGTDIVISYTRSGRTEQAYRILVAVTGVIVAGLPVGFIAGGPIFDSRSEYGKHVACTIAIILVFNF
jgi:hypothetical protein